MNKNIIAELLERAESMLEALNTRHEEDEADTIGYPHMQNLCQLMQTIAMLKQAQHVESANAALQLIDQDLQYIMRQFDGFRMTGFPVEDISK